MAEIVNYIPRAIRKSEYYEYDQWFNGEIWKITQGVDYAIMTRSMANRVKYAAHKRELNIKVVIRGESIYIQKQ